ncbi:hypothetical protein [Paenibacillus paeoniae]|uniref:Uncharacterized protein n=1 Tax=Paenibacillus paeoniae TaxID=2292705 RepID=A0A371PKJ4_9BACL|nr:hypothetical protein [Paenibacillus paeoniae]REK76712.1 hypothetical protein DX130_06645 [Paenibacillus paeoniae]
MSLFYYIAANHELPTGSFGHKKQVMTIMEYLTNVNPSAREQFGMQVMLEKDPEGKQLMEVFETEEDAAGIYVVRLDNAEVAKVFTLPFVYQVNPEGGSYTIDDSLQEKIPHLYIGSQKCVSTLLSYLDEQMKTGDKVELYSCWADGLERFEEQPIKELELNCTISEWSEHKPFSWKKRQLIRLVKDVP